MAPRLVVFIDKVFSSRQPTQPDLKPQKGIANSLKAVRYFNLGFFIRPRRQLRHDCSRQRQVDHPVPVRRGLAGRLQVQVHQVRPDEVPLRKQVSQGLSMDMPIGKSSFKGKPSAPQVAMLVTFTKLGLFDCPKASSANKNNLAFHPESVPHKSSPYRKPTFLDLTSSYCIPFIAFGICTARPIR